MKRPGHRSLSWLWGRRVCVALLSLAWQGVALSWDCWGPSEKVRTSAILGQIFIQGQSVPWSANALEGSTVCVTRMFVGSTPDCVAHVEMSEKGFFSVKGLPDGEYRLQVRLAGFATFSREILVTRDWPLRLVAIDLGSMCSGSCDVPGSGRGPVRPPSCLKRSGVW
jgi:hypothetical protein